MVLNIFYLRKAPEQPLGTLHGDHVRLKVLNVVETLAKGKEPVDGEEREKKKKKKKKGD